MQEQKNQSDSMHPDLGKSPAATVLSITTVPMPYSLGQLRYPDSEVFYTQIDSKFEFFANYAVNLFLTCFNFSCKELIKMLKLKFTIS